MIRRLVRAVLVECAAQIREAWEAIEPVSPSTEADIEDGWDDTPCCVHDCTVDADAPVPFIPEAVAALDFIMWSNEFDGADGAA